MTGYDDIDLAIAEAVAAFPDSFIARDVADSITGSIGRVSGYTIMPQTVAGAVRRQPGLYHSTGWGRNAGRGNVYEHYSNGSSQVYRADRAALAAYLRRRGSSAKVTAIDPDAGKTGVEKESIMGQDRLPTQAKLHICVDGNKDTLYVASPTGAEILDTWRMWRSSPGSASEVLEYGNTDGETVVLDMSTIVSIVVPTRPAQQFTLQPGIFDGRKVEVRGYAAYAKDTHMDMIIEIPAGTDERDCVVVIAEDLAAADVLVYDLANERVVWANPASPSEAIDATVQAVRLLARAETAVAEAYEPATQVGVSDDRQPDLERPQPEPDRDERDVHQEDRTPAPSID